jgi:glycosyltransferase involved in cell wall biosynthesis
MALRVAQRMASSSPETVFLMVGDGPERESLHRMARDLNLNASVRFLGERSDVGDLLCVTDVAILTSPSEGLPNVLIEAGLAGVPSVSTDNGGAGIVVVPEKTGFLVPKEDDLAMSRRIQDLLQDDALRRRLGESARERMEKEFSMKALGDRLMEVYQEGLEACASAPRLAAARDGVK